MFLGAKVESVGHTGEKLPRGTRAYQPGEYVPEVKTAGQGAVVALLSNGGRQFLVVVNRDLHEPMPLSAAAGGLDGVRPGGQGRDAARGGRPSHEAKVEPGDVYILTWLPRRK